MFDWLILNRGIILEWHKYIASVSLFHNTVLSRTDYIKVLIIYIWRILRPAESSRSWVQLVAYSYNKEGKAKWNSVLERGKPDTATQSYLNAKVLNTISKAKDCRYCTAFSPFYCFELKLFRFSQQLLNQILSGALVQNKSEAQTLQSASWGSYGSQNCFLFTWQ